MLNPKNVAYANSDLPMDRFQMRKEEQSCLRQFFQSRFYFLVRVLPALFCIVERKLKPGVLPTIAWLGNLCR